MMTMQDLKTRASGARFFVSSAVVLSALGLTACAASVPSPSERCDRADVPASNCTYSLSEDIRDGL